MKNLYYNLTLDSLNSLFCTFSVMVAIWNNYVGLNYKLA